MKKLWFLLAVLVLLPALPACESQAISRDAHTTFLEADDLQKMTDQMAQSIVRDQHVAAATAGKPIVIVMKPVVNNTNEIIRAGEKEMYVARVRGLLAQHQSLRSRFTFVLNRQTYEALLKEEGAKGQDVGPVEDATLANGQRLAPEYALTATFSAKTNVSSSQRSDYYLCTYQLTRLAGSEAGLILWEDKYEVKKAGKKGMLD